MDRGFQRVVKNIPTFVQVEGVGSPLVMLHGIAATSDCWRYCAEAFRPRYQVIALDLPGHGRSGGKARPYSLQFYVDWLHQLLADLEVTQAVTLIGNSMGGAISVAYALTYPERTRRLVLVDPLGFSASLPWEALGHALRNLPSLVLAAITRKTDPYLMRAISPWIFRDPWGSSYDAITRMAFLNFAQGFWSVGAGLRLLLVDFLSARQRMDFLDRLAGLTLPMLVIWGRHDGMLPLSNAAAGLSRVPQASVKILEQSSHSAMLEQPEEFNRLVRQFITGRRVKRKTPVAG